MCGLAIVAGALLLTAVGHAQAPSTQSAMHGRVHPLYDFHPRTLTAAQRTAKSGEMDAFWNDVAADKARTLPLLRVELQAADASPFFEMDGTSLLLSLSHTPEDLALAARCLPHVDLTDVVPRNYFMLVHELTGAGVDTSDAGLHVLDDAKFMVPVPQHAMTLDQEQSLVYLLLPVDARLWTSKAEVRFKKAGEQEQRSLLALYFFAQTDATDRLLREAADDRSLPESVRKAATGFIDQENTALTERFTEPGTEAEVRATRAKRLTAVSDEAVGDMMSMTGRLVQLRHAAVAGRN